MPNLLEGIVDARPTNKKTRKAATPSQPVKAPPTALSVAIPFGQLLVSRQLIAGSKLGSDIERHNGAVTAAADEYERSQEGLGVFDKLSVTAAELIHERELMLSGLLSALQAAWQLGTAAEELHDRVTMEWRTEYSTLLRSTDELQAATEASLRDGPFADASPNALRGAASGSSVMEQHREACRTAMRAANYASTMSKPAAEIGRLLDDTIKKLRS